MKNKIKTKIKAGWLKIDAHYAATPKVDKIVIGSAMVLAMGSVAWAAVPAMGTGAGNQEANVAGAQVQIYDRGGQLSSSLLGKLGYGQGGDPYPLPRSQKRSIVAGSSTDCSSWANYVDSETKKTSMAHIDADFLDTIMQKLNNRPRKRHGFISPASLFNSVALRA
jgi:hypothetical protein